MRTCSVVNTVHPTAVTVVDGCSFHVASGRCLADRVWPVRQGRRRSRQHTGAGDRGIVSRRTGNGRLDCVVKHHPDRHASGTEPNDSRYRHDAGNDVAAVVGTAPRSHQNR